MQLTPETMMTIAISVAGGAFTAWLGNRVMNAELYGHVRKHCSEIAQILRRLDAERAGERLAVVEYQLREERGA